MTGRRWAGPIAFEAAPTEDGRILEPGSITWSMAWPLPLFTLPEPALLVGTIESVDRHGGQLWGTGAYTGAERYPDDRVAIGIDVDLLRSDADAQTGMLVIREGRLKGAHVYAPGSEYRPAWPGAFIMIEEEPSEAG
jgi:hypothetical protein